MHILGLDCSLNCTGWFLFNTDGMQIIDYGFIPNTGEEHEKVARIYKLLSKVLDNYKVDAAGIEEEFYSRNVDTLKKLSHVHGAVLLLLSQRGIPYTYYSVMTAKSQVLGGIKSKKEDGTKKNGNEMKQEVADKIFEVFGRRNFIKDFTNDVTDAASIGLTYHILNGKSIKQLKLEEEKKKEEKKKEKKKDSTKSKKTVKKQVK